MSYAGDIFKQSKMPANNPRLRAIHFGVGRLQLNLIDLFKTESYGIQSTFVINNSH